MKKQTIKKITISLLYGIPITVILSSIIYIDINKDKETKKDDSKYRYVNSSIFTGNMPVALEEEEVIKKPFKSDKVEISKKYYDNNSSNEEKQNSLIYYNDTYVQNSGILYKSEEKFDVTSILDGSVIDVKKDDILGNIVEIKHSKNLISTYEGLSTVNVKKNQLIKQGDIVGTSGKLELGEPLENALHFELIDNGKYVNPLDYYEKKINNQ